MYYSQVIYKDNNMRSYSKWKYNNFMAAQSLVENWKLRGQQEIQFNRFLTIYLVPVRTQISMRFVWNFIALQTMSLRKMVLQLKVAIWPTRVTVGRL